MNIRKEPKRRATNMWTRLAGALQVGRLLDFDGRDAFELLLDGLGLVLGRALLDRAWARRRPEVLRLPSAERGDFANGLDGVDLVGAEVLQDHLELGLLVYRRSRSAAPPPATHTGAAAAAETPSRSSSFFHKGRRIQQAQAHYLRLPIAARSAMFFSNHKFVSKLYFPADARRRESFRCARPGTLKPALRPKLPNLATSIPLFAGDSYSAWYPGLDLRLLDHRSDFDHGCPIGYSELALAARAASATTLLDHRR